MVPDLCTALDSILRPLPGFMLVAGLGLYLGSWFNARRSREVLAMANRTLDRADKELAETKELLEEVRRVLGEEKETEAEDGPEEQTPA